MAKESTDMRAYTLSDTAQKKLSGMCTLYEKFTRKRIDENELLNRIVLQTAADLAAGNEETAKKIFQEMRR